MTMMKPLNLEIWLHILHSGSWWSAREIDEHFGFMTGTSRRLLHDMEKNGVLTKRQIPGTRCVRFSVTPLCSIPRGVNIGQVQIHVERQGNGSSETEPTDLVIPPELVDGFDFSGLTLLQRQLLDAPGWQPGAGPHPSPSTVRKLIDRRLVYVEETYFSGARVPCYRVPTPVQRAWRSFVASTPAAQQPVQSLALTSQ